MSYKPKYTNRKRPEKRFNPLILILVAVAVLGLAAVLGILLWNPVTVSGPVPETEGNDPTYVTEAPTTSAPTTEPTTVPTTEPIVYFDPLNGEILDGPFTGRIYASTVANEDDAAIPHVNTLKADVIIEAFVNNNKTRCLALFSDPSDVEAIGSVRSTRLMFNDIAQHYNLILAHGGGSSYCLDDADSRGIDHYNVDSLMNQNTDLEKGTAYRDRDHLNIKYGDANLYAVLPGVKAYAESQGVQVSGLPETDYGLRFQEDGTPASGEDAGTITVNMVMNQAAEGKRPVISRHDAQFIYNAELDKYVWNQYGKEMHELFTGEPEAFQNVVILYYTQNEHVSYGNALYYSGDFLQGGTGYYANGGKLIPITWSCESDTSPFRFFHEDGTPLAFGQGNTYMALCPPDSEISWTGTEAAEG